MKNISKICLVENCNKKSKSHSFCSRHYYKFKKYGDPLAGGRGASPGEPLQWIKDNANYTNDDCLVYPYEKSTYGYGTIRINNVRKVASRVMCEIAHGAPPEEYYQAAHSCGNGHLGCMNPKHLSWKTRKENELDKIAHGTKINGEKVIFAKLKHDEVIKIKELLQKGIKQKYIAESFNVSETAICHINRGATWGHVNV